MYLNDFASDLEIHKSTQIAISVVLLMIKYPCIHFIR